jgi:competence protein ComGC
MALSAMADYFVWWQIPLLIGLIVVWFGGWLLLWVGGKYIAKSRKATLGRSLLTWFLACVGASLMQAIYGAALGMASGPMKLFGPFVAGVIGLVVMWAIIKGMFRISFGKAILAWLPTLAATALMIPLFCTLVLPTLAREREMVRKTMCGVHVGAIGKAIQLYEADNNDAMPETVVPLVRKGLLPPDVFLCPATENKKGNDYFYRPGKVTDPPDKIICCDFGDNHSGEGRNVLYANLTVRWLPEAAFQQAMLLPENRAFAEALREKEPAPKP